MSFLLIFAQKWIESGQWSTSKVEVWIQTWTLIMSIRVAIVREIHIVLFSSSSFSCWAMLKNNLGVIQYARFRKWFTRILIRQIYTHVQHEFRTASLTEDQISLFEFINDWGTWTSHRGSEKKKKIFVLLVSLHRCCYWQIFSTIQSLLIMYTLNHSFLFSHSRVNYFSECWSFSFLLKRRKT